MNYSFLSAIAANCERRKTNFAFRTRNEFYTYAHLAGLINEIIKLIANEDSELIGVVTGDDIYTYAAILAILFSGRGYVPLNKKNPSHRNLDIIGQANLKTILCSRHSISSAFIKDLSAGVKLIEIKDLSPQESKLTVPSIDDNRIAYLLFTSGSTGSPKGVPIYHKNLNAFLYTMTQGELFTFSPDDRFLQMFELTFDFSVMSLFVPLVSGACCYVISEKGILFLNVYKMLQEQQITIAPMVPSVLNYLRPYFHEINLPHLKQCIYCGEALYESILQEWHKCAPNALMENMYGPTEATVFCMHYHWDTEKSRYEAINDIVPIGKPFNNTYAAIMDEDGNEVSNREEGELCLGGIQVTNQYWNDEVKTAKSFIKTKTSQFKGQIYRTGDLAYLNENGNYIFCGRIDFQVKIDGYRVEMGEIEFHARNFENITNAVAMAVKNDAGKQSISLFIETRGVDKDHLINHLKAAVAPYMLPKQIIQLRQFPYNQNGKTDRQELLKNR